MRDIPAIGLLIFILSGGCAVETADGMAVSAQPRQSVSCEPQAPDALIVDQAFSNAKPSNHNVMPSTFKFSNSSSVRGPCAKEIVLYNVGEIFLSSTERLQIKEDGQLKYFPHYPLPEIDKPPSDRIEGMPGYRIVMAEKVLGAPGPLGEQAYIGLLKGPSDNVIARFDVLGNRLSRSGEVLLRTRSELVSIDFLPSPDSPSGSVGIVEMARSGGVRLSKYDWNHGRLEPLPF